MDSYSVVSEVYNIIDAKLTTIIPDTIDYA